MGASSVLGLLLEISADPSKAQAALGELQGIVARDSSAMATTMRTATDAGALGYNTLRQQVIQLTQNVAGLRTAILEAHDPAQIEKLSAALGEEQAMLNAARGQLRGMGMAAVESNESLRALQEMVGVNLPGGMMQLITRSSMLRDLLAAAFPLAGAALFIAELPKIAEGIANAASAMGGFTKAVQDWQAEIVKSSSDALIHFKTVGEGMFLIAQSNVQLAALEHKRATQQMAVDFEANVRQRWWMGLLGPAGIVAAQALAGKQVIAEQNKTNSEIAALQGRLNAQLEQMTKLETDAHKAAADAAMVHGQAINTLWAAENNRLNVMHAAHAALQRMARDEEAAAASAQRMAKSEFDAAMMRINLAIDEVAEGQRMRQMTIELMPQIQLLAYSQRELHLAVQQLTREFPQLSQAEIQNLAAVKLADPAYRQMIDDLSRQGQAVRQQRIEWQMLSQQVRTSISEITGSLTGWGGVASRVFDQVANQIIRQIELDQQAAIEHHASQASMATSTLNALKATAFYKAYEQTAAGFAALADFNFWSAAQHFAAAALYGVVAGAQVAAVVGAMGGGGAARGTAVSAVGGGGPAALSSEQRAALPGLPPGYTYNAYGQPVRMAPGMASPVSGKITVMVVGDAGAARWMAGVINAGAQRNDLSISSTRSKLPSTVRR